MDVIWASLIGSVLYLAFLVFALRRYGMQVTSVLSGLLIFIALASGSHAFFLQTSFTFIAVLICAGLRWRKRMAVYAGLLAFVISHAMVVLPVLPVLKERAALRREYPLQPVAHRLSYEMPKSVESQARSAEPLSEKVKLALDVIEDERKYNERRRMLQRLHAKSLSEN